MRLEGAVANLSNQIRFIYQSRKQYRKQTIQYEMQSPLLKE